MEKLERWSAVVVQPKQFITGAKSDIKANLKRYCEIVDLASVAGASAKMPGTEKEIGPFAPVKLVAFPEFFISGWHLFADVEAHKRNILIEIPGEETEILGQHAKQNNIYIAGANLEYDSRFPDIILNCAFIIDPSGKVIHKYHKLTPAIHFELTTSPHDVFDRYIEVYGQDKSILETFFPVTDTPLGKMGTFICMDGHYPETSRALAMNGAEILIRPTAFPMPLVYEPFNTWEIENRMAAYANLAYVVAPNTGMMVGSSIPEYFVPGDSMVVDPNGMITLRLPFPGESFASSVIDIGALRARRADPSRNFPTQLRTEVYKEIYKDEVYPKNLLLEQPIKSLSEAGRRASKSVIEKFYAKGIYTAP